MMKRVALFGTVLMTGLLLGACSQQTASQSSDNTDQSSVSVSLKERESRVAKREKQVSKDSSSLATSASQSAETTSSSASSTSDQSSVATSTSAASVTSDKMSQTTTASQSAQNATSSSSAQNTNPTQPTTVDGNQAIKLVIQQAGQQFGQSASYLNNGLITRGGQQGYLINIYAPNEDSPRAGYFVTQTGQVEQIW